MSGSGFLDGLLAERRRSLFAGAVLLAMVFALGGAASATAASPDSGLQVWRTTGAQDVSTSPGLSPVSPATTGPATTTISVDDSQTDQPMVGFGATLTDSSAFVLMMDMGPTARAALLQQLFDPVNGIGLDYIRIPIGGNDYSQKNYSLLCAGQTFLPLDLCDPSPSANYTEEDQPGKFALSNQDTDYLIPVLQQILAINPAVQILATPWTAPAWMKCNTFGPLCLPLFTSLDGGMLQAGDDGSYATYLVSFVQAYEAHGIPVAALTLDNEPADPNTSLPSMIMLAPQEETVAADVHSDLTTAGLSTQIIGVDDNWDDTTQHPGLQYAQQLLGSPEANDFAGVAFHCYKGDPSDIAPLTSQFPTKSVYETECTPTGYDDAQSRNDSVFSGDLEYNTQHEVIDGTQAGSGTVMFWNLALDQNYGPTINGSCVRFCEPIVEVNNGDPRYQLFGHVTYEVGYYVLAHVSQFVRPGAVRIESSETGTLQTVAFKNTESAGGRIVLVVLNTSSTPQTFNVTSDGQVFTETIPGTTVDTLTWVPTVPPGSCAGASSMIVMVQGSNVTSYVPKGNWSSQASDTGVSVVNIEGNSITPTTIATPSAVNSCAPDSLTGVTACTANNGEVYLISGTSLTKTLTSAGSGQIGFSGGDCTSCGIAMDATGDQAAIGLSVDGEPGFQFLDLASDTFDTPFTSPAGDISEEPLIDPVRHLLLSASEDGTFEITNVSNPSSPVFYENETGGGELDSTAEDCSTGIALAPAEFSAPSSVFIADLTQATLTPGSPAGTWTAPSQNQILSESDLSAGPTGIAVAQGTHTGFVTGEFGGSAVTALALPTTSGTGTPAIRDWITCSMSSTPDGQPWSEGDDPHTVAAYQSPNGGDAIGLFGNQGATWLARVDLTQMLNPAVVPRDSAGHACASGTLPASVESFMPVP